MVTSTDAPQQIDGTRLSNWQPATLFVPPRPILAGLHNYAHAITFDSGHPLGVKCWTDVVGIVCAP